MGETSNQYAILVWNLEWKKQLGKPSVCVSVCVCVCVCVSNDMSALVDGLSTTRNFVCILYTYEYIKLNVRITVNDELEMGWKEMIATHFTVISQHLSEWNWETHKKQTM
jgi:hypothetical protein